MSEQEQEALLSEWLEGRPEIIAELAKTIKPWKRYIIKKTGQHCYINSYSENGTVTVIVDGHDSELMDRVNEMFNVSVFGVLPDDLETIS